MRSWWVFSLYIIWEPLLFQYTTIVSLSPAWQLCETQALSSQNLLFNTGKLHSRSILSILLSRLNKSHHLYSSSQKSSSSQLHSPLLIQFYWHLPCTGGDQNWTQYCLCAYFHVCLGFLTVVLHVWVLNFLNFLSNYLSYSKCRH